MDIFESLENLNVSEECFEEIINIVEDLLNEEDSLDDGSHIRKKYGKPEYEKNEDGTLKINNKGYAIPSNKSAKLYAKAHPNHHEAPSYNDGKGYGEYGKRIPYGESDRKTWVTMDTPKEIQEPLSVAKSQEKGARKLLDKNEFKNKRDKIKAKRLLQGALIDKSSQLHKKADYLDKEAAEPYNHDEDDTAGEISGQAQQRRSAAQKASKEARHIHNELANPEKPEKKVERVHKK